MQNSKPGEWEKRKVVGWGTPECREMDGEGRGGGLERHVQEAKKKEKKPPKNKKNQIQEGHSRKVPLVRTGGGGGKRGEDVE
jgi:hypothetical protein